MTLRAMASNDDRIIDYFRSISQGKRPSKSDSIIDFVVPDPIKVNLTDFVDNIETQAWHRLAKLSWMPFEEARIFAQLLNLKTQREWQMYCINEIPNRPQKPVDIPTDPARIYSGKGWDGFGDWLGTGAVSNRDRDFWPFEKSRIFARLLKLKNREEWRIYCRGEISGKPPKPDKIPVDPAQTYTDKGWLSMDDWLGSGNIATRHRQDKPFNEAQAFVRLLKLKNREEWVMYCKGEISGLQPIPKNIPKAPSLTYKNKGWRGWGHWLGTGTIAPFKRKYWVFKKARAFVHSLKLKSNAEWRRYCKGEMLDLSPKPKKIPVAADVVYRDEGWQGWGDWFGTGIIATQVRSYLSFKDARTFTHSLNLKRTADWVRYCKGEILGRPPKPENIPSDPARTYADKGWVSWPDWLGKD